MAAGRRTAGQLSSEAESQRANKNADEGTLVGARALL